MVEWIRTASLRLLTIIYVYISDSEARAGIQINIISTGFLIRVGGLHVGQFREIKRYDQTWPWYKSWFVLADLFKFRCNDCPFLRYTLVLSSWTSLIRSPQLQLPPWIVWLIAVNWYWPSSYQIFACIRFSRFCCGVLSCNKFWGPYINTCLWNLDSCTL